MTGPWTASKKPGLSLHATLVATVVCNTALNLLILGGAGWAVFGLDRSPWWLLAAVLVILVTQQSIRTGGET